MGMWMSYCRRLHSATHILFGSLCGSDEPWSIHGPNTAGAMPPCSCKKIGCQVFVISEREINPVKAMAIRTDANRDDTAISILRSLPDQGDIV